ncbi:MAG: hypothetical protein AAGD01_01185 [Acidobacteriota bacterium]
MTGWIRPLLAAWILLAAAVLPAYGSTAPGLLLWAQDHHRTEDGSAWTDDVLIFRDGEIVVHRVYAGGEVNVLRGSADGARMASLGAVLQAEQIGLWEEEHCRLEVPLPTLGDGPAAQPPRRSVVLSWFGREGRRQTHVAMISVGGERCAEAQERSAQAILEFAAEALVTSTPTAIGSEAEPSTSLLFEIHNQMLGDPSCDPFTFIDRMLIFRDGLFLRLYRDTENEFMVVRTQIERDEMALLAASLQQHRVGTESGECYLWFLLPFFVNVDCQDFSWASWGTWFGRSDRRATLTGAADIVAECSDGQQGARDAIMQVVRIGVSSPERSEVRGTLPAYGG